MGEVRALGDALCHGALCDLPYAGGVTPGSLLELLWAADSGLEPGLFDTVFLSPSCLTFLLGRQGLPASAQMPHPDVLRIGGLTVVAHEEIRCDAVYFTSRSRGPALVHGPTVVRCEADWIFVDHHCYVVPAQGTRAGACARLRQW